MGRTTAKTQEGRWDSPSTRLQDIWEKFQHKGESRQQRIGAWLMVVMVLVESSFLFIQAGKGFRTKSAKDVDLAAFIILLMTNMFWVYYGYTVIRDLPVLISGLLYTLGSVLVIVTIALYG